MNEEERTARALVGQVNRADGNQDAVYAAAGALHIARNEATRIERAAIVAYMKRVDWNQWVDEDGPVEFDGDHRDLVRAVADMVERGEHRK